MIQIHTGKVYELYGLGITCGNTNVACLHDGSYDYLQDLRE
ncbi:MAG: hypothetical protein ABIQ31_21010 [Ferruginibacter sp.]